MSRTLTNIRTRRPRRRTLPAILPSLPLIPNPFPPANPSSPRMLRTSSNLVFCNNPNFLPTPKDLSIGSICSMAFSISWIATPAMPPRLFRPSKLFTTRSTRPTPRSTCRSKKCLTVPGKMQDAKEASLRQ